MKRSIIHAIHTLMALCLGLLSLQAPLLAKVEFETKVRGSAFIPTSDLFRDIYGSAAGNFDAEFAVKVYSYLQAWVNVDYMQAHGHSLGFCNPTAIRIVNGSFGLKSPYDINDWATVYVGFGPTFGRIHIKDESQFSGCSSCSKTSVGFVAKSGVDFFFGKRWFADVFLDYVYQHAEFQKHVNASAVRVGAGLGVTFDVGRCATIQNNTNTTQSTLRPVVQEPQYYKYHPYYDTPELQRAEEPTQKKESRLRGFYYRYLQRKSNNTSSQCSNPQDIKNTTEQAPIDTQPENQTRRRKLHATKNIQSEEKTCRKPRGKKKHTRHEKQNPQQPTLRRTRYYQFHPNNTINEQ